MEETRLARAPHAALAHGLSSAVPGHTHTLTQPSRQPGGTPGRLDLAVAWHRALAWRPGPGSPHVRRAVTTRAFAPKLARTPHPLPPVHPPFRHQRPRL